MKVLFLGIILKNLTVAFCHSEVLFYRIKIQLSVIHRN